MATFTASFPAVVTVPESPGPRTSEPTDATMRGATPAPSAPDGQRDPVIDNARFLLIALVVLGHVLTTMRDNPVIDVAYTWIYMFHMPAFVFLSGLVIRNAAVDPRQGARLVSGVVAPLVIFTVLYELFGRLVGQPVPSDDHLLDPYWLLWFLAALALWRLLVPVLHALRWPVATTVAVATGLALVADLPAMASIDRFIVLMPFFAAGLLLTPDRLRALRTDVWRLAAVGVVVASGFVAVWVSDALPNAFITFSDGVQGIGDVPEFLAMYGFAAAMIAALLALAPGTRRAMTRWGTRTIYVYLLHGFFIRAFRAADLGDALNTPLGWLLVLGGSLGLAILLASDPIVRLTRRLVEPRLGWLLRPTAPAPRATGSTAPDPSAGPTTPRESMAPRQ